MENWLSLDKKYHLIEQAIKFVVFLSRLRPTTNHPTRTRNINMIGFQFSEHIPGSDNLYADLLSRLQVDHFLELVGGGVNDLPTEVPASLMPDSCRVTLMRF